MPRVKRPFSELTGGTGDVNPQTLIVKVTQSNIDTVTQSGTPLPIPRFPLQNGKSIVMEFLSLDFDRIREVTVNSVITNYLAGITTNPSQPQGATYDLVATQVFDDPRVMATWNESVYQGAANTTAALSNSYTIDLTDEAGHGVLIATDNIYFFLITSATTVANVCWCRIKYRFKEVTLQEYIGIVQSQQ